MHYMLRDALRHIIADCERTNVLRSEDAALADRARARAAKVLLLHNATTEAVEAWLGEQFPEEPTAVRNLVSARAWPEGQDPQEGQS